MPPYPGSNTLLVVNTVDDTTDLDRKGHPATTPAFDELPGCHLAPETGSEETGTGTDYSKIVWRITAPALPAAMRIKSSTELWFVDGGDLVGRTQRATYTDADGIEADVAVFNVETSWPHYVDGLPQLVSVVAKSEVG